MATETISTLNSLLRGEIAATETYQQALGKVASEPGAEEIRRIHREHREAANSLRQHVRDHGATPDHSSGVWGAFSKALEGMSKLFGNSSALCTLREGEKQGRDMYKGALDDADVSVACKQMIRARLLPQTEEHIRALDRLMEAK